MKRANELKAKQLGMAYGTASNRLKKAVMLRLLQKLGEDFCFRCNAKIETAVELSIDHKVPWLNGSPEQFWDLENIAFSHLRCNIQAGRWNPLSGFQIGHTPANKKVAKEGLTWCGHCAQFKATELFGKNKARWNGLNDWCRDCRQQVRGRLTER